MRCTLTPEHQLFLPNQDWHLEHLYDFLPGLGIAMLKANFSRYLVDLNRRLKEPWFGNFWQSPIARQTAFKAPLYTAQPDRSEQQARIERYYRPYHDRLTALLEAARQQHGRVLLLDLHSFASGLDADVCLGTGNGTTAAAETLERLHTAFCAEEFACVKNHVFNGGYITRHYGQMDNVEAIQVELHYRTYLEPQQLDQPQVPDWQGAVFAQTRQRLVNVMRKLTNQKLLRP